MPKVRVPAAFTIEPADPLIVTTSVTVAFTNEALPNISNLPEIITLPVCPTTKAPACTCTFLNVPKKAPVTKPKLVTADPTYKSVFACIELAPEVLIIAESNPATVPYLICELDIVWNIPAPVIAGCKVPFKSIVAFEYTLNVPVTVKPAAAFVVNVPLAPAGAKANSAEALIVTPVIAPVFIAEIPSAAVTVKVVEAPVCDQAPAAPDKSFLTDKLTADAIAPPQVKLKKFLVPAPASVPAPA